MTTDPDPAFEVHCREYLELALVAKAEVVELYGSIKKGHAWLICAWVLVGAYLFGSNRLQLLTHGAVLVAVTVLTSRILQLRSTGRGFLPDPPPFGDERDTQAVVLRAEAVFGQAQCLSALGYAMASYSAIASYAASGSCFLLSLSLTLGILI